MVWGDIASLQGLRAIFPQELFFPKVLLIIDFSLIPPQTGSKENARTLCEAGLAQSSGKEELL
jgi:hypothetical protein